MRILERAEVVRSRVSRLGLALALLSGSGAPASQAAVLHLGAQDPGSQGWIVTDPGTGVVSGPVAADPAHPGVAAWAVDDASTVAGSARWYRAPESELPAAGEPWHFAARLRVVDLDDAVDLGVFIDVTDATRRRFLVTFGSDATGQTRIHVSIDGASAGGPNAWTIAETVPASPTTEYLSVDLVSNGTTAELHVDGQQVGATLAGYAAPAIAPRVAWGAGSSAHVGHGHYAKMRFERGVAFECGNGVDDDGDGAIDFAGGDGDCASTLDPLERPPVIPCDDGVDSDGDTVCNADERRLGTNASATDSDGDGLADADELVLFGTDPALADSDGDGFSDPVELAAGRDPNDPASGPPPVPAWDWSMAERFIDRNPAQAETNGDRYFSGAVTPASWRVDFDACATGGLVFEYRWYVDDALVSSGPDCDGFHYDFPAEGAYGVRLETVGTAGETFAQTRPVTVDDLLIFGLGDSYGSGEGNPDRPVTNAMVDEYADALDALADTQAQLVTATAALQTALATFNDLVARINAAFDAYDYWQSRVAIRDATCPFPIVACAQAQAAATSAFTSLVVALANVGIPEPSNLTPSAIYQSIVNVYNAGLAVYNLAVSAFNSAQAAVALAQQAVGVAKGQLVADWQNVGCHRSADSGQVQAARRLAHADPHTSVTFVHLACSGSQIRTGNRPLIGTDGDPAGATNGSYQVAAMRALAAGREVDALFVSIGGNDVGFASLIEACAVSEPCFQPGWVVDTAAQTALDAICTTTGWFLDSCALDYSPPPLGENASTMFQAARPELALRYASLHRWLEGEYPRTAAGELNTLGRIVAPDRVFLTQYPDCTRDDAGQYCGWTPSDPIGGSVQSIPGVSAAEHAWASLVVSPTLESDMRAAASANGWSFVDGISEPFGTHGYCAVDAWIVRIAESLVSQGDPSGTAHPDRFGHDVYADRLEASAVPEPASAGALAAAAGLLAALTRGRRRTSGR